MRRLGDDLTAADLVHTGVDALLCSGEQFDAKTVGTDLARYATRGDVERLELVGLNACDLPDGPVPVAGWELVRLGRSGVEDLMPVPAAARFMPRPGWDLTAAAKTWWLRRPIGRKPRCKGRILDFSGRALHEQAPAPLLALALADDALLRPVSCYVVEPGVAVHRNCGEDLDYDYLRHGPEAKDVHPQFHDHESYVYFGGGRSQAEWPEWLRFCEVVGPMVEGAYQKASVGHQGAERLIRAAGRFLDAVMDVRTDVPPRHLTVLALSIALETLLETSGQQKVTRKFINRAVWLGARNDAERADICKRAEALYKAGSDYRHGGKLGPLCDLRDPHASQPTDDALDVADCRYLTRQLLLHGLALLDSGTSDSVGRSLAMAEGQGEASRCAQRALRQAAKPGARDSATAALGGLGRG